MSTTDIVPLSGIILNGGTRIALFSQTADSTTPDLTGMPGIIDSLPLITTTPYLPARAFSGGDGLDGFVNMTTEPNGDTSGIMACTWHDDTDQYVGARAFRVTQQNQWKWGLPVKFQTIAGLNNDNRTYRQSGKIVRMNSNSAIAFFGGVTDFRARILNK
jgi:hypothetical protein